VAGRDNEDLDALGFDAVDDAPVAGAPGVEPLQRELERFAAAWILTQNGYRVSRSHEDGLE
jgi:hypothetical protein